MFEFSVYDKLHGVEDFQAEFDARDRFRNAQFAAMTPVQRLEDLRRLQAKAKRMLELSPEGHTNFLRRNFKLRAIDVDAIGT